MLRAKLWFLPLLPFYFTLDIAFCAIGRPNDNSSGPVLWVKEHWKGICILPLPRFCFLIIIDFFSYVLIFHLDGTGKPGRLDSWPPLIFGHGEEQISLNPTRGTTCNRQAKTEVTHASASSGLFTIYLHIPEERWKKYILKTLIIEIIILNSAVYQFSICQWIKSPFHYLHMSSRTQ